MRLGFLSFFIFLLAIFIIITLVINNHFYFCRSTCEAFFRFRDKFCYWSFKKCILIHFCNFLFHFFFIV
jgi:hypothetical protein